MLVIDGLDVALVVQDGAYRRAWSEPAEPNEVEGSLAVRMGRRIGAVSA